MRVTCGARADYPSSAAGRGDSSNGVLTAEARQMSRISLLP
jgi:hypothetical protein